MQPATCSLAIASVAAAAAAVLPLGGPAAAQTRGAQPGRLAVRAENPLAAERREETITIPWSTLQRRLPGVAAGKARVLDAGTGREVVSQVLDEDGDGRPDELLFQASFWASEAKSFVVEPAAPTATFASRVHARHD